MHPEQDDMETDMKIALSLGASAFLLALATPAAAQDGTRMMDQMAKADSDHDGKISKAEFVSYRSQQFDRLDRDGNGVLDDGDMPRMAKAARMIKERTAGLDADGNGVISRSEFDNGATTAFDMADANRDGYVTSQELDAARATLQNTSKNR